MIDRFEEKEQLVLINTWHAACQKGNFEYADQIYERYQNLLKILEKGEK